MKSILQQYRLSAALDDTKMQPDLHPLARREKLRAFAQDLAAIDQQLKAARPDSAAPDHLHGSIMAKVQRRAALPAASSSAVLGWWAAPATAAVLIACFFGVAYLARRPAAPSSAPRLEKDLATFPDTVLSPLSDELQKLQRDLETTTDFLLASVP